MMLEQRGQCVMKGFVASVALSGASNLTSPVAIQSMQTHTFTTSFMLFFATQCALLIPILSPHTPGLPSKLGLREVRSDSRVFACVHDA